MGAAKNVFLAVLIAVCTHTCSLEAKMLPETLPWLAYSSSVSDLGQHLRENVPRGHHNVIVFARKVVISTSIDFNCTKYVLPEELSVVCDELHIASGTHTINMACRHSPDLVSFNDDKTSSPLKGINGCSGGSFTLFARTKTGSGSLRIDTRGGNGRTGQDGYIGKPGSPGADGWFVGDNGNRGEDGGDGGQGGDGGNARYIGIALRSQNPSGIVHETHSSGGSGGQGGGGGRGGDGGGMVTMVAVVTMALMDPLVTKAKCHNVCSDMLTVTKNSIKCCL